MWRFLKYSYTLPLCLLVFCCKQVQQEEKQVTIPFTQDDITQIYSLALDSLLGPTERWLDGGELNEGDNLVVQVIYRLDHHTDLFEEDILSEERYWRRGEKKLKVYDGFSKARFEAIVEDSTWDLYTYETPDRLYSRYNYKLNPISSHQVKESYHLGDTLGAVALKKIAFNEKADHAIVQVSYYKHPEWGGGNAYFLKKENDIWRVVGVFRIFIS